MLYYFVRPIARLGLRLFYRKIYFSHTERIPRDKPVILAANHPTAFIEPCLLACFLGRPLYFLVRGNLFRQRFYDLLLRSLHMLPIFRLKDGGYGKLKNNYDTFKAVFRALEQNKTVMILAEGSTMQCKRLRPLQKGTARLALGALDSGHDISEVYVVPVGANFTYADRPRSRVMIEFGEPILASDYLDAYQQHPNQAIRELTDDLFPAMERCLVNIPNESDELLTEYLLRMRRSELPEPPLPIYAHRADPLQAEQSVADRVRQMPEAQKAALQEQVETYFERLGQFGLSDRALLQGRTPSATDRLLLVLGWPFYIIGRLLNWPLIWPGKHISETKVKTHEFIMPVRWAATLGAYLAAGLLAFVLSAAISWWIVAAFILIGALGWFALYYGEFRQRVRRRQRLSIVPEPQLQRLREMRKAVCGEVELAG